MSTTSLAIAATTASVTNFLNALTELAGAVMTVGRSQSCPIDEQFARVDVLHKATDRYHAARRCLHPRTLEEMLLTNKPVFKLGPLSKFDLMILSLIEQESREPAPQLPGAPSPAPGLFRERGSLHAPTSPPPEGAALGPYTSPVAIPPQPTAGLLSALELANSLGMARRAKTVDSALRRYAAKHRDCRVDVDNPRRGEPRYVYRTTTIWPVLLASLPRWRKTTME